MKLLFNVVVTFRVTCGFCPCMYDDAHAIHWALADMPYPMLRAGWRSLDGVPVCPAHLVVVRAIGCRMCASAASGGRCTCPPYPRGI